MQHKTNLRAGGDTDRPAMPVLGELLRRGAATAAAVAALRGLVLNVDRFVSHTVLGDIWPASRL